MSFQRAPLPGAKSIDEFLGHSNRGRRQKLLTGWKNSDSHSITVWLSMLNPFLALWRHNWMRVQSRTDRQTQATTREVWGDKLVCYEHEETLQNQDWRNRDTGARDYPPQLCPHCKMIEHVRSMVTSGEIPWTTPVFSFRGDDPSKNVTLLAGGLYNAFGAKFLTPEQKAQMAAVPREHGGPVYSKNAFKQNQKAKLEYAFTVVNDAKPEDGLQITIEPNLLGQKVQDVIAKSRKELGSDEGNPMLNPFAFLWEFNPADDVEFNRKYDATRLGKIKLRPAIEKLIRDTEPPSLDEVARRFNLEQHRANLERHALIKLPWDEFFRAAREDAKKPAPAAPPPAARPAERMPEIRTASSLAPDYEPAPPADEEKFACENSDVPGIMCRELVLATTEKCSGCGYVYKIVAAEPAEPPRPSPPKRSQVAAPVAQVAPQESYAADDPLGDDDSDIPF